MANTPLSDVTVIATVLGSFFLIVAFYKSIFHKRRTPAPGAHPHAPATPIHDDQPIKLADPFQQVPVDALPQGGKQPQPAHAATTFYPTLPPSASQTVSAFRQFTPNKEFNASPSTPKNEVAYEWE